MLKIEGFIEDGKEAKAHFKCVDDLTKIVMDKARVGFGTTAACTLTSITSLLYFDHASQLQLTSLQSLDSS